MVHVDGRDAVALPVSPCRSLVEIRRQRRLRLLVRLSSRAFNFGDHLRGTDIDIGRFNIFPIAIRRLPFLPSIPAASPAMH